MATVTPHPELTEAACIAHIERLMSDRPILKRKLQEAKVLVQALDDALDDNYAQYDDMKSCLEAIRGEKSNG